MAKLSASRRIFLAEAASSYHESIKDSPAAELLADRGLYVPETKIFGLGFVAEPFQGHEIYRGRLSIPYYRDGPNGRFVVSIRFRCSLPGCTCPDHPKYLSTPGDDVWLFNTPVLLEDTASVAICEGELDAVAASVCGVPAVGVPGAESWQPYFASLFAGYDSVFILADGDAAGKKFANTVAKTLTNSKIMPCGDGDDVNSEMIRYGREHIARKVRSRG